MKTIKILWDLSFSLTFRFMGTAGIVIGVCLLLWAYLDGPDRYSDAMMVDHWRYASTVLGILIFLLGAAVAFRRGSAEQNFSVLDLAGAASVGVAAAGVSSFGVMLNDTKGKPLARTLRRFPVFESMLIGLALIGWWLYALGWPPKKFPIWIIETAAIVGVVQMVWGATFGRQQVKRGIVADIRTETGDGQPLGSNGHDS